MRAKRLGFGELELQDGNVKLEKEISYLILVRHRE